MKITLHIAFIFFALAVVPQAAAAQPHRPAVAAPVDRTKKLSSRSLSALGRTVARTAQGRGLYLSPMVTALSVVRSGGRAKVACTVRVVVTRVAKSTIEARAIVVEASAQVISTRRGAQRAPRECVTAAGAQIARTKLAAL